METRKKEFILKRNPLFIYLILLFCIIAWGSNFVFGTILVANFDPSVIAFFRLIFIVIFLFFVTFRFIHQSKLTFTHYVWIAIAGFLA
ncbi:EamA family transporter [Bacillus sp. N9]